MASLTARQTTAVVAAATQAVAVAAEATATAVAVAEEEALPHTLRAKAKA